MLYDDEMTMTMLCGREGESATAMSLHHYVPLLLLLLLLLPYGPLSFLHPDISTLISPIGDMGPTLPC